ncbi:hypothetical protein KKF34_14450 [Myxococcota bacterium]|nr:hypothetical protein [Myxococcota bacterium]MBU1383139.1 hypothetical protein [Myxococcota bacterium]MBU1498074.1 hypothetical protein [Myxococcota bacterium]
MKIISIFCFLSLISCSKSNDKSNTNGKPAPPKEQKPSQSQKTSAVKSVENIEKTVFIVENDTKEKHSLDITWGKHKPFRVVPRNLSEVIKNSIYPYFETGGCNCRCKGECMVQDQPPHKEVSIEPGKSFTFEWNNSIIVWNKQEEGKSSCCSEQPAKAGSYLVSVCTTKNVCGTATVNLPSKDPVKIQLSSAGAQQNCTNLNKVTPPLAVKAFVDIFMENQFKGSSKKCTTTYTCVDEKTTIKEQGDCSITIIPRTNKIEILGLYKNAKGKYDRYSVFFDNEMTRVIR